MTPNKRFQATQNLALGARARLNRGVRRNSMRRTSLVTLGVLGVAMLSAVLYLAYFFWLDATYTHAFDVVAMGSSEAERPT